MEGIVNQKSGFTLIELMIVVSIIALLVVLSISHFSFLDETIVHQEIEKLYASCKYAQQIALITGEEQIMQFDIAAKTYLFNGHKESLSRMVAFGYKDGTKGPPSSPAHAISHPITFKSSQIVFSPSGIIASGTIYLTDVKKQRMYALSAPVSQVSYLRKYRYDKKWVLLE